MRVGAVSVVCLWTAACAPRPPLRAVVDVGPGGGAGGNTVLALPTGCVADDEYLCDMAYFYTDKTKAPKLTFDEIVHPIVRIKLELAGYTVIDPRTLRLETGERTDVSQDGATSSTVEQVPTVDTLPLPEIVEVARSINLANMLVSTVHVTRVGYAVAYELILELRGIPTGDLKWTVKCRDTVDVPGEAVNLLANCAGDGVLAWRAPDAVIGQLR